MLFLQTACPLFLLLVSLVPSVLARRPRAPHQPRQRYPDYRLKTSVINGTGDAGTDKDGLYITPFLTGPGLSDAILADAVHAPRFWLNGTYEEAEFVGNSTFGLTMIFTPQSAWNSVQVDAGFGNPSFYFDANGLQWQNPNYFGGWLACDWNHGVPQLFWKRGPLSSDQAIPASCSYVNLVPEY